MARPKHRKSDRSGSNSQANQGKPPYATNPQGMGGASSVLGSDLPVDHAVQAIPAFTDIHLSVNRTQWALHQSLLPGEVHRHHQLSILSHQLGAIQGAGNPAFPLGTRWVGAVGRQSVDPQGYDWMLLELECARRFNFSLSHDLSEAVQQLEQAVNELTGTGSNVILLLDEETGTYTCLNDEHQPGAKVREITQISDNFLQELLHTDEVIHRELILNDRLLGIVAIAHREDGESFDVRDELLLERVARYLSAQIHGFQTLKQALLLPYIQNTVLDMASHLVGAPDQDAVLTGTLNAFLERFEFDMCQYVALDNETGEGYVVAEGTADTGAQILEPGLYRLVPDFGSMVSLFSSSAWQQAHLYLRSGMLGDKPLATMFGIHGEVQAALVVPVLDAVQGRTLGALTLFFTRPQQWVNQHTIDMIKELALMVSLALGRTRLLERAMNMAISDELTGLTNRRGFYERFEVEIERTRRNPGPLSVAMIDVDHFKHLNDTHGHLCGDRALRALAKVLAQNVRKSDLACRFGGEEFAILLPDTTAQAAADLVDRIRKKVEKLSIAGPDGEAVHITISAGVAPVDVAGHLTTIPREIIADALACADSQLYEAKDAGRNQVLIHHNRRA